MTSSSIPFGPRLIGQTEKTLNAILECLLDGSPVSESQWVALNVSIHGGAVPAAEMALRIASSLKVSEAEGVAALEGLLDRGLAAVTDAGVVAVTTAGREFHEDMQARIGVVTQRLWGDIPASEREAAAETLNTVLQRAGEELNALQKAAG
jgi:hypothetical protein